MTPLSGCYHHLPRSVSTSHRPRPFQQNETVLSRSNGGDAETESTDQIQDLIRSRLRGEAAELLRRECIQNEHRSNERDDLKNHDETILRCNSRFSLCRIDGVRADERSDA